MTADWTLGRLTRVPDEHVIDDGSGDIVVSVPCQDERHIVRLHHGRLSFEHHDDLHALAAAGEAAALAKVPQCIRCAEILIVWRYWVTMGTQFPGASRTFALPQALIKPRSDARRVTEDRRRWRESEERRMHRVDTAHRNKIFRRLRQQRQNVLAVDRYQWVDGEWKYV